MDLVSISPATRTVALGRVAVEVSGLSLRKLTQLIAEYPGLLAFAAGGTVNIAELIIQAPEMALAIFAIGVIGPSPARWWRMERPISDDNLLAAFDRAATGQQLDILSAIIEATFEGERGGPFLKSVLGSLAAPRVVEEPPQPVPDPIPDTSMPISSRD